MDNFIKSWLILIVVFLQSCAHSDLERATTCQIDQGVVNQTSEANKLCQLNIADKYQSANQTTRGFWLGGAAGALTGGATSIGVGPGALIGAILGGAVGYYIDAHTSLIDRIENQGGKIFILGDQVMIVFPSSNLFYGMTPCLRSESYCVLTELAQLISCFPTISVQVAAFTNDIGDVRINQGLSQQQAESVVKALWKLGVNTRLLYAVGRGPCKLVEMSRGCWNDGNNYRIEITLERLPEGRCCS